MTQGSKQLQNAAESIFELIEFRLDRKINGQVITGRYGINVVKVREVVRMPKINPLNSRLSGLAGVFELRGVPIPVINLPAVLGDERAEISKNQKVIVTEFGVKRAGFIVDATHRIRRVNWSHVMPPAADSGTYISAMTLIEDNEFLFILDFERILADIDAMSNSKVSTSQPSKTTSEASMPFLAAADKDIKVTPLNRSVSVEGNQGLGQSNSPLILLVDDSSFILKNTKIGLQRFGLNVMTATNGAEALGILENYASGNWNGTRLAAVVTDIEMPQMDGFILTKNIRAMDAISDLPIIIHSSLSGKATQDTGMAMGANGYVVKNDIKHLVEALSEIIGWKPNIRIGA
jgi:two-component system chemotaxis response regulator CheV